MLDHFEMKSAAIAGKGKEIALIAACAEGKKDAVKDLLERKADPNQTKADEKHINPLMKAVLGNHIEIVKLLLDAGANLYVKGRIGESILHRAAMMGYSEMVTYILARDFNPWALNNAGKTAADVTKDDKIRAMIQQAQDRRLIIILLVGLKKLPLQEAKQGAGLHSVDKNILSLIWAFLVSPQRGTHPLPEPIPKIAVLSLS